MITAADITRLDHIADAHLEAGHSKAAVPVAVLKRLLQAAKTTVKSGDLETEAIRYMREREKRT